MELLALFAIFTGPWWLTAGLITFMVVIVGLVSYDKVGWASFWLFMLILLGVGGHAYSNNLNWSDLFTLHNVFSTLKFVVVWCVIGFLVSVVKWYFHSADAGDRAREVLVDIRKMMQRYRDDIDKSAHSPEKKKEQHDTLRKQCDTHKPLVRGIYLEYLSETDTAEPFYHKGQITELILQWTVFWPAYLISFLVEDLLRKIVAASVNTLTRFSTYAMGDAFK